MGQRQDYMENQISLLSRMLKRLLEKLMKTKSADADVLSEPISICHTTSETGGLMIKDLQTIEDSSLVSVLTETYGYTAENMQVLADILYEMMLQNPDSEQWMHRKALVLYEYCWLNAKGVMHLSTFLRMQELKQ